MVREAAPLSWRSGVLPLLLLLVPRSMHQENVPQRTKGTCREVAVSPIVSAIVSVVDSWSTLAQLHFHDSASTVNVGILLHLPHVHELLLLVVVSTFLTRMKKTLERSVNVHRNLNPTIICIGVGYLIQYHSWNLQRCVFYGTFPVPQVVSLLVLVWMWFICVPFDLCTTTPSMWQPITCYGEGLRAAPRYNTSNRNRAALRPPSLP